MPKYTFCIAIKIAWLICSPIVQLWAALITVIVRKEGNTSKCCSFCGQELHQYVMCEMCTALVPRWSNWHNWPQPIQKPDISIRCHKCYTCFYPRFSFISHNLCFITFRISVTQEMSATTFIYVARLPLRANCYRID